MQIKMPRNTPEKQKFERSDKYQVIWWIRETQMPYTAVWTVKLFNHLRNSSAVFTKSEHVHDI